MPRPCRRRLVWGAPTVVYFKPQGVPLRMLAEVVLKLDELEALRLADLEGLSQEEAGQRMGVSRATFGRIVESARRKTAQVLVHGMALRIEGGSVKMTGSRKFLCADCGNQWTEPFSTGQVGCCPQCESTNIRREVAAADMPAGPMPGGRGRGGGMGRGRGRGGGMGGRGGGGRGMGGGRRPGGP